MGEYAGRSYWLCTYNWSGQNYPISTAVYNKMGGFSNGYVPLFIIVGFQNKVYWDDNSSSWEAALKRAIDEMATEGVFVNSAFSDKVMIYGGNSEHDISDVFFDLEGNPVTVTVESNSNPEIVTATVENNTLYLTAGSSSYGTAVITLRGTAGEFSATDEFNVTVYDSYYYNTESYESGTFEGSYWGFSGNAGWSMDNTVSFDGTYSAKSDLITHNQKAEMAIEADYPTAGKISYKGKASCESGYDHLRFYIDGVEKKKISGNTAWMDASFDVEAGNHIFKWAYTKDASSSSYSDCVWVDYITFLGGRATGIENEIVPAEAELMQNYPNPFNPSTKISFLTSENGFVKLSVYNQKGELVQNVVEGELNKGSHRYEFNASDLTSGIYFYKLQTKNASLMKKMMLLK
jgi:hypothetical protein